MTRVLLYSGGVDSAALRLLWSPEVCLYVNLGTPYSAAERARLDSGVTVIPLTGLDHFALPNDIIPARNLVLVALASTFGEDIALAATAGDRVRDKTPPFAEMTSTLLTYLWDDYWSPRRTPVTVHLPVKSLTKVQLLQRYKEAGGDLQTLAHTSFSCYAPVHNEPCGTCKPCYRKWVAFKCHGLDTSPNCEAYVRQEILPVLEAARQRGETARGTEDADVYRALGDLV